jgi:polyisoprenoid-binding protein YceI
MPLALVAMLVASALPPGAVYDLDPSASSIRFHVVHKLHEVDGTSGSIDGKAVLQADGRVLAMVRAPLAEFRTGDRNRDTHLQEVLEPGSHPFVVFKGVGRFPEGPRLARAGHGGQTVETSGEIELHGLKQPVAVPVAIEFRPDGTARAKGSFSVSLDSFRIQRPSLLFVPIDDACRIDVDLVFREVKP